MKLSVEERETLVSQTMREQSDYNCVYEISSDELRERIEPAKKLIALIEDRIRQVTP